MLSITMSASTTPHEQRPPSEVPAVNSQDLLQGQKTVAIHHNGAIYLLQATRLGKLILTK
jgi:hemin uptake protein HemP